MSGSDMRGWGGVGLGRAQLVILGMKFNTTDITGWPDMGNFSCMLSGTM